MAEVEKAEKGGHHKNEKRNSMGSDMDVDTIRVVEIRDMITIAPKTELGTTEKRAILPKSGSFSDESFIERVSEFDDVDVRQIVDSLEPYATYLHDAVKKLPLVSDTAKLPYSVASSNRVFLSWNIGRQKSVEWHRARLVQAEVILKLPVEILKLVELTVKSIVVWCRQNRYGPPVPSDDNDQQLYYCRYCGMIEDPPPRKGEKRLKSSWGVDAYCRCGQNVSDNLALMKTASSVQDMINRSRSIVYSNGSPEHSVSLTAREIRALLLHTDVTLLRWTWSSILQFNLPCSQPTMDNDTSKSEEDTLVSTAVITHATRSFLCRLIQLARQQSSAPEPEPEEDEVIVVGKPHDHQTTITTTAPLVITPIHILLSHSNRKGI